MRPQIFHRIQFWGVSREKLQPQAPTLLAHKIPHQATAMAPQAISNNQQLSRNVPQKMFEELRYLRAANAAGK